MHLIIETICGTGIRVSELKYFTVEGVQNGTVTVNCKGKTRSILVPSKLRKLLLRYAKLNKINEGIIFRTRSGKPVNRSNIWSEMKKLCKSANVNPQKVFPHNLRKLFARTFYGIEKDISSLGWITMSATCTSPGTETRTCSKCKKVETKTTTAAKGHSFGSWVTTKSATCTASGTKTRTCTSCGYKETQTIAATGHKYTTTVVAPTISSMGYTLHKCSVCGYSYKDNYTDQLKPTNPNAPQIVVDSKTASVGGQVIVNVVMKNNPGINGWAVNVSYDSSVLELVKCDNGVYSDITTSNVITKNPYHVQWYNLGDVKTNGNLFTLTFNVKQTAKEGVYPIKLTYDEDEICNQKEEKVHFDVVDGFVKVSKHMPGDINNDGKVNLRDVIRLNQYVAGWNVTVDSGSTDVNGDGKTNLRDVIRLNQYVAGWNVSIQ